MRIPIVPGNEGQIAAALTNANGRSTKHAATVAAVFRIAGRAERQLTLISFH